MRFLNLFIQPLGAEKSIFKFWAISPAFSLINIPLTGILDAWASVHHFSRIFSISSYDDVFKVFLFLADFPGSLHDFSVESFFSKTYCSVVTGIYLFIYFFANSTMFPWKLFDSFTIANFLLNMRKFLFVPLMEAICWILETQKCKYHIEKHSLL